MSKPLVTVLLLVYNAERYVAEAVESILARTFADQPGGAFCFTCDEPDGLPQGAGPNLEV